jgi:hypothetical protein
MNSTFSKAAVRAVNHFTRSTETNKLDECLRQSLEYLFNEFDKWPNSEGQDAFEVGFLTCGSSYVDKIKCGRKYH